MTTKQTTVETRPTTEHQQRIAGDILKAGLVLIKDLIRARQEAA